MDDGQTKIADPCLYFLSYVINRIGDFRCQANALANFALSDRSAIKNNVLSVRLPV